MSINLENFEYDIFAKTTPDVLTSPRSLKACSQLLIEPTELVYKNLEEYEETLGDLPLSQVYQIYETEETDRQGRLLKCRELRNRIISVDFSKSNKFHESAMSEMKESDGKRWRRNTYFGGSDTEVNLGSDTESHKENFNNCLNETEFEKQKNLFPKIINPILISPKLKHLSKSNINFKKISNSPRQFCPCQINYSDNDILTDYIKRYGATITSGNDLSRDDKKFLELLILKKARQAEWNKRSEELRQTLEEETISQFRVDKITKKKKNFQGNQLNLKNWQERLAKKRQLENVENTRRYLVLEEQAREHRFNLVKYLEHRDSKIQDSLEQLQNQKRKQLLDRNKQEALRQLEVGKVIDRLLEADRNHRHDLAEKLEQKMIESEIRRKRKVQDNLRHLSEMNKLEELKRVLIQERLDQEARQSMECLRHQLEEKEHRATMNYLANLRCRNTLLSQGAGNRNQAVEKTLKVHKELLQGLQEWNEKVYDLHLAAQERATINYYSEINRRRARIASERVLRQERSMDILKRMKEIEERRLEVVKTVIESKDSRSARLKEQKEQRIYISRLRAQHAADLRETVKEKLDPDTFAKKAARADMEYRLMKKYSSTSVNFTNQFPRVTNSHCRCKCGCGIVTQSRHNFLSPPTQPKN